MRSLGKPKKGQEITASVLKRDETGLILDKHSPLKQKLDQMLIRDYSDWRTDKYRFNAINSQTAKNRQLITQYLHAIYDDYQIHDPLQDKYTRQYPVTFLQPQKYSTPTKNLPISNQTKQNLVPHLISIKSPFKTPTKSNKKGLQLVNPKQSQFSVSIPKQKPQFVYLTPQKNISTQRTKIKYAQRTAPSLHSSFLFSNSMNQDFSQSQMNKNFRANDYQESPYQSRLSLAARLADRSNDKSRHTIFQDVKPLQLGLNSRENFYQQKTYPYLSDKNNIQITFGSEQSLEKNNPQREYEIKKFQEKLYAQKLFENFHQISRVGFNPKNGSIKQSFRYCVGCEEPILEANINVHQNQCLQFKKILNLRSIEQIIKEIDLKIQKILEKINEKSQQVHENDPQKIISSSKVLVSQVEDLKKIKQDQLLNPLTSQSFNWQYDKVMGIGKNWGLLTEEVNKLKWFLIVKNNFVKLQNPKPK